MPPQPHGHEGLAAPLRRLAGDAPEVVLTFDDGPNRHTPEFAEILRQERIPAVFFWLGDKALPGLDDVSILVEDGHQIGCHGVTHRRMSGLTDAEVGWEIAEAGSVLGAKTGHPIRFFRPPFGDVDERTLARARDCGMAVVLWDVDTRDWAHADEPRRILDNAMKARPGSIILMHQRPQTLAILPELIAALRSAGFAFRGLPDPPPLPVEAEGEGDAG